MFDFLLGIVELFYLAVYVFVTFASVYSFISYEIRKALKKDVSKEFDSNDHLWTLIKLNIYAVPFYYVYSCYGVNLW